LLFSVPTGNCGTPQEVVIATATAGATIHYTTNGVDPTESDPVLAAGSTVLVDHGLTLKARAWAPGLITSSVAVATYTVGAMVTADVTWTNAVGVQVTGNNLRQPSAPGGWNTAGAISQQGIVSLDGYLEFTATETTTLRMCGLSHGDSNQNYSDIDYAIYLNGGTVWVYESGTSRGSFGAYATGDVFRVSLEGGAIKYRKNGVEFYASLVAPALPLVVDTALCTYNATLGNVVLHGVLTGVPPIVSMTVPANNAAFAAQTAIALQASASAPFGSVTKVEFYNSSTKLGEGTLVVGQPGNWLLLLSSGLSAGSYTLTAVATDNLGLMATSAPVAIQVNPSQPLNVTFNPPPGGTMLAAPANLTLSVNASDPNGGTITKVEFFQDGTLIGTVTSPVSGSPTLFNYTPAASLGIGSYLFTAKAYDNFGLVTTTAPLAITVLATLPYTTDFEAGEGYAIGSISGQQGWTVNQGTAQVITQDAFHGTQSVLLQPSTPPAQIEQVFAPLEGTDIIFVDFHSKPVAGSTAPASPSFEVESSLFAFALNNASGELQAFNGDGLGGGTWTPTGLTLALGANNQLSNWARLTARLDFTHKTWDLYANGAMVLADLGFRDSTRSTLSSFFIQGDTVAPTLIDYFFAAPQNPIFADVNNNGIDDAWETQNGLLLSNNNRALCPSGNGISVLQSYIQGCDPNDYYQGIAPVITSLLDSSGQPGVNGLVAVNITRAIDGTPLANAPLSITLTTGASSLSTTPNSSDLSNQATIRTDAQGIAKVYLTFSTYKPESIQVRAISGTTATSLTVVVQPPATDSDGSSLPDLWQQTYFGHLGVDPSADSDGDGSTNLQEFLAGTDPTDASSGGTSDPDTSGDDQAKDAYIMLPEGMYVAQATSNGHLLLANGDDYYRWYQGSLSSLFTGGPSVYYDEGDNVFFNRRYAWDSTWLNSLGGSVLCHRDYMETQTGSYLGDFQKPEYFSSLEDDWVKFSIGPANIPVTVTPQAFTSAGWFDGDELSGFYLTSIERVIRVRGIDDLNRIWVEVKDVPINVTFDGDYPECFYIGNIKLLDMNTRHMTESFFIANDFAGVNCHGVAIGTYGICGVSSEYRVGNNPVPYQPLYISECGAVVGRHSDYTYMVHFSDGNGIQMPSGISFDYSSITPGGSRHIFTYIDNYEQLHAEQVDFGDGTPLVDRCVRRKRDADGNSMVPVQWEEVGTRTIQLPGPWITNHQVSKDKWDLQAGWMWSDENPDGRAAVFFTAGLAVDADRDGTINFPWENDSDHTSKTKPFRFWINDDYDGIFSNAQEAEEDDLEATDAQSEDWRDNVIGVRRDLEDFARIHLFVGGLQDAFKNGDLSLGLKWTDTSDTNPAIKLYRATDTDGGTGYLSTPTAANRQSFEVAIVDARYPGYSGGNFQSDHTLIGTGDFFVIPTEQAAVLSATNSKMTFIFEGCTAGHGQLKFVILKKDGTNYAEIGEGPGVWMDLKEPKEFIQRWTCGDGDRTAVTDYTLDMSKSGSFAAPSTNEEKDLVLYVHGYNMQEFEKQRWIETTYKRLYWLGFKGRVGGFSWPCAQSALPYDESELRAWQSGEQLRLLLDNSDANKLGLKQLGYRVHVIAHSQGNVVIGEALRQAGVGSNLVWTYVASQAALPGHCYNPQAELFPFQSSMDDGTPNVYARYWKPGSPDRWPENWPEGNPSYFAPTYMNGAAGKYVNFYNDVDYALTGTAIDHGAWELTNKLKPDGTEYFSYNSTDGFQQRPGGGATVFNLKFPDDRFGIFAYGAEGRSLALGARATGGVFTSELNLRAAFNFTDEHIYHSGQFRSFYAARVSYWTRLLVEMGLRAPE
jgi:hypothetical protein